MNINELGIQLAKIETLVETTHDAVQDIKRDVRGHGTKINELDTRVTVLEVDKRWAAVIFGSIAACCGAVAAAVMNFFMGNK